MEFIVENVHYSVVIDVALPVIDSVVLVQYSVLFLQNLCATMQWQYQIIPPPPAPSDTNVATFII